MKKSVSSFIKDKNNIKRFTFMSLALLIAGISFNIFVSPVKLVAGGAPGLAIIFNKLFSIDSWIIVFLISFIGFIISLIFLNYGDTIAALYSAIVYPLCIKITQGIDEIFLINNSNVLLFVIFAGIFGGISQGIIYKQGLNTGGLNVISKIFYRYFNVSISNINFLINLIIVLVGAYIFGFSMILYACVYLFIARYISERIMLGVSRNKAFYIISDKYVEIIDYINNKLKHDATIYNVLGKYDENKEKLIMSVISTSNYYDLKNFINAIDENAFVFICDSYEVYKQDLKLKTSL